MIDIYRVFHPSTRQYTFFSTAHETFSKIDHILRHKASLNKFNKIEITLCIISDHNRIKLGPNNKRYHRKYSNTWRLKILLKNKWVTEKTRVEIKKFLESNENENATYQNLWDTTKAVLRGTAIKPETSQINNLGMYLKFLEKEEQTKPQISRHKEITKIRVEINEIETKQAIQKNQ
jgi:hypothetical protein